MSVRFTATDEALRPMGRATSGVTGMRFKGDDELLVMEVARPDHTVFTVTDIADGKVVLDGNHPWAGKRLRFDCHVLEVRSASAEEVEHGHVHGPGAHHHH